MPEVSASVERYLAGIYVLQEKHGVATTGELVKLFGVAFGTVTNTVRKLKNDKLVVHQPYRGVYLTEEGHSIALCAVRKHRLLTRLLTDLLDVEPALAYSVASNIAYYIPDSVLQKITEKLKNETN
jgi:DtxR family Mn-dependent transcriptional regulator